MSIKKTKLKGRCGKFRILKHHCYHKADMLIGFMDLVNDLVYGFGIKPAASKGLPLVAKLMK